MNPRRKLGRTDIEVSEVGLGCWQFSQGGGLAGRYWPALEPNVVREIVGVSLRAGINWFDTAEAYGNGASERSLVHALHEENVKPGQVVIATKWLPFLRTSRSLRSTIDVRLRCLDGFGIDLHQIHQPFALSPIPSLMSAMADLVHAGKIRSVGVSNFSASQMRRAHEALQARGLALASNQVHYSLLHRQIESNGTLAAAKEIGATIIAYSPLEQGLLSGKFHDDPRLLAAIKGPRRFRAGFRRSAMERSRPLIEVLKRIAAERKVTPAQVALRWLLDAHGETVVVIPGATKVSQAEQNAAVMGWRLEARECEEIEGVSRGYL